MMADPLSSVIQGQPIAIRAAAWNEIVAAARDRRQKPRPNRPVERFVQTGCVEALAFNDTGADLAAFKPAKVTATGPYDLTTATAYDWARRPVVTIGTPGASTDMVAVTLEAIPEDQFGRVAVAGWCACDVDVSDSGHRYASPTTDTDALVSGTTGSIRILNTGTGTARRCAVYLGDQVAASSGSITYAVANLGSSHSLTSASGTWEDIVSVVLAAGTWAINWTLSGNLNAATAGDNLIARLYPGSSFGYGWGKFCTAQVTGVGVKETGAGAWVVTLGGSTTLKLQAAREYSGSAPSVSEIIGNSSIYASGMYAIKVA